jgi:geranyl-CoA carboxylase alpha subunit
MRLVTRAEEIGAALASARSEAQNAFGSGELILEKAIVEGRHVEIQVFADAHGNAIHLGERDCSVQRRHQKVIEEAPSPAVSPELRTRMGADAVAAARAIGYRGAGTVEFLLDKNGHFYFLEMNTRLQVEHPVTEMVTGLDLVAWQLRIAAGGKLPLTQDEVRFHGHAIEARLYAEAPHRNFLPQTGTVLEWEPYLDGSGVRIDAGIRSGQKVTPYYDPMLAKVIAHGGTREEARHRLVAALRRTRLMGLETNRGFLVSLLAHPEFAAGEATTAFIPRHFAPGSAALARAKPSPEAIALAAANYFTAGAASDHGSLSGWRSTGPAPSPLRLEIAGERYELAVTPRGAGAFDVASGPGSIGVKLLERRGSSIAWSINGRVARGHALMQADTLHLDIDGLTFVARDITYEPPERAEKDGAARLVAPMNGRIVSVQARVGDMVAKGQRLVVLEAMKMQHEITAGRGGTVATVSVREGDQVATQQVLVTLAAEADAPPGDAAS